MAATVEWLHRTGAVPPELRPAVDVRVCAMFVGREEHRADPGVGLRHLNIQAPLLTVGQQRVRLSAASGVPGLDDFAVSHRGGLPPARIPVDHQSRIRTFSSFCCLRLLLLRPAGKTSLPSRALPSGYFPNGLCFRTGLGKRLLDGSWSCCVGSRLAVGCKLAPDCKPAAGRADHHGCMRSTDRRGQQRSSQRCGRCIGGRRDHQAAHREAVWQALGDARRLHAARLLRARARHPGRPPGADPPFFRAVSPPDVPP
jgi:hypothetical protein